MKTKLLIFIFALFIFSFKIASLANAQYKCTTDCTCLGLSTSVGCSSYNSNWSCSVQEDVCGASCVPDSSCGVGPTDTPAPTSPPNPCTFTNNYHTCTGTGGPISDQCASSTSYRYALCGGSGCYYSSTNTCLSGTCSLVSGAPTCGSGPTSTPGNTCSTNYPGASCEGGHSLLSDPCTSGGTKYAASQPYCPNWDGSSFYFCCGARPTPTPTTPVSTCYSNGGTCASSPMNCPSGYQYNSSYTCSGGQVCCTALPPTPTPTTPTSTCGNTSGEYCKSGPNCLTGETVTLHTCAGGSEICCKSASAPTPTPTPTQGPSAPACWTCGSSLYSSWIGDAWCDDGQSSLQNHSGSNCGETSNPSSLCYSAACVSVSQICTPGSIQYICSGTKCP